MNVASRPIEVKTWIGSKKKAVIPDVAIEDYSKHWSKWWDTLQPAWRVGRGCNVPESPDWTCLQKGGTSGIYTVVVSLAWWAGKVSNTHDSFWELVGDVEWVLRELAMGLAAVPKPKAKRPLAAMDEGPLVSGPRKR